MASGTVEAILLPQKGTSPNNGVLPLLLYRGAVKVGRDDPEGDVERAFGANNWGNGFRGDTFPFHHYHSIAHEVVGCSRGKARIQFGGPEGPVVDVSAGDAVLIPAGVVHCRVDDAPGYCSVGAYPPGQQPDLCVLSQGDADVANGRKDAEGLALKVIGTKELPATQATIAKTPLPPTDPIGGSRGAVQAHWLKR